MRTLGTKGESITYTESFAIVDVAETSESHGKILLLLDDEATAKELAKDLRQRRLQVAVRRIIRHRGVVVDSDDPVGRTA